MKLRFSNDQVELPIDILSEITYGADSRTLNIRVIEGNLKHVNRKLTDAEQDYSEFNGLFTIRNVKHISISL